MTKLTDQAVTICHGLFFVHEVDHLGRHISKMLGIDQDSEDVSYLCGDIAQALFKSLHRLFCDECRE